MKHQKRLISSVSFVLIVCLIIGMSVIINKIVPETSSIKWVCHVISILGFALCFLILTGEAFQRIDEAHPIFTDIYKEPFPAQWLSFTLLYLLTISTISFSIWGFINMLVYLDSPASLPYDTFRYISFYIALPVLNLAIFILLYLKSRNVRLIDFQKHFVMDFVEGIKDLDISDNIISGLEPEEPPSLNTEERKAIQALIQNACRYALLIASSTGLSRRSKLNGVSAILFAANTQQNNLKVIGHAGCTPKFKVFLRTLYPAFFDAKRFTKRYNEFIDQNIDRNGDQPHDNFKLIKEFRDSVQEYASTAGIVYAVERRLVFKDMYYKCLTTSFKFMEDIPDDEKSRCKFRQVIGIPITIVGKKVGVLLLLSNSVHWFHPEDKAYWVIGHIISNTMQIAINAGYFASLGLPDLMRNAPKLDDHAAARIEAINVINDVDTTFKKKLVEG